MFLKFYHKSGSINQLFHNSHFLNKDYKNDHFLTEVLQTNSTNIVVFSRLNPLLVKHNNEKDKLQLLTLSSEQFGELSHLKKISIYIGNDSPQVGVSIFDTGQRELSQLIKDKFQMDTEIPKYIFDFRKLLDDSIWKKLRGMFAWHYSNLYCGLCGTETISINSGYRRVCQNQNCYSRKQSKHGIDLDWISYPRIDPITAVLPETKKHPVNELPCVLLGRNETFPPGLVSCLTGFVEPGETVEMAAIRELKEEVGLDCEQCCYLSSEYWPMPSAIFLGYSIEVTPSTHFNLGSNELSFADWFNVEEVKLLLERKHLQYFIPPRHTIMFNLIKKWYDKTK